MRTTIDIPDHLLRQAKILAAAEGCRLADVVSEGLEAALEVRLGKINKRKPKAFSIKASGKGGLKKSANLSNNVLLRDIMDGLR